MCLLSRRVRVNRKKRLLAYVTSVRLPVRRYHGFSHWTDFCEISYWGLPRKSVVKVQICLKSDENLGHITRTSIDNTSSKCFISWRQCKKHPFWRLEGKTQNFYTGKTTCRSTTVQREYIIASPLKSWLRERAIMLRYAYTAYIFRKPKH
jgi:hypothetical protein